jgi:hypothetical protein
MRRHWLIVALASVIGSLGLVAAVLGTIAAIDTWTDVDNARTDFDDALKRLGTEAEDRTDFEDALRRLATEAEEAGEGLTAISRRDRIVRRLETQGIQLVEVDGDASPEFLRYGDQLVELPEPAQIPKPPTFLEESGGEILVAVVGAAIAGVFLVWATLIGRRPQLDEATDARLARIESQLVQDGDNGAPA